MSQARPLELPPEEHEVRTARERNPAGMIVDHEDFKKLCLYVLEDDEVVEVDSESYKEKGIVEAERRLVERNEGVEILGRTVEKGGVGRVKYNAEVKLMIMAWLKGMFTADELKARGVFDALVNLEDLYDLTSSDDTVAVLNMIEQSLKKTYANVKEFTITIDAPEDVAKAEKRNILEHDFTACEKLAVVIEYDTHIYCLQGSRR